MVQNIDDDAKRRLRQRSAAHSVSVEEEIRAILQNAVRDDGTRLGLGSEIAALFERIGVEGDPLEEFPGRPVRPATFDD